jgi:hypothetical protein
MINGALAVVGVSVSLVWAGALQSGPETTREAAAENALCGAKMAGHTAPGS